MKALLTILHERFGLYGVTIEYMKFYIGLLACALGTGSLFAAAPPASAAPVYVRTVRPATTVRVYRPYPYRAAVYRPYGYPYGVGFGVGVGVGFGYPGPGYGYVGGYGYAPYPAVYGPRPYWAYRPYWRPYRRVYWGPRVIR